jgi:hypothetical protein
MQRIVVVLPACDDGLEGENDPGPVQQARDPKQRGSAGFSSR